VGGAAAFTPKIPVLEMERAAVREIKVSHSPGTEEYKGDTIIHHPEEWRVEDIDCDGDGGCAIALFSGPFAAERADRYADIFRAEAQASGHAEPAKRMNSHEFQW
jgi:hypothetical protein